MEIIRGRVRRLPSSGAERGRATFSQDVARRMKRRHKRLTEGRYARSSYEIPPKPNENVIADALLPKRAKLWRTSNRKSRRINVSSFSFIDDPSRTLDILRSIALAECQDADSELNFRMSYCVDIAPLLVLGLMRRDMIEVFRGGKVTSAVEKVLRSVHLAEFLNMGLHGREDNRDIWAFPLREMQARGESSFSGPGNNTRDKVAYDLSSRLSEWLSVATERDDSYFTFSEEGRDFLSTMVCEILENCERHGPEAQGIIGEWACAGFLAKRPSTSPRRPADYVCHLAFVNTGQTIAEGIARTSHELSAEAQKRYVGAHARGRLKPIGPDEDVLRTVLAIQPGITRQQIEDTNSGGIGFRRILDAVYHLNEQATDAPPQTVIISGHCCVRIADLYTRVVGGSDGVPGLYFNKENSMALPPDPRYAFALPHRFPGTIIATRFLIDPVLP